MYSAILFADCSVACVVRLQVRTYVRAWEYVIVPKCLRYCHDGLLTCCTYGRYVHAHDVRTLTMSVVCISE